jgi:tetratricopeptide (TPR) repeat protein
VRQDPGRAVYWNWLGLARHQAGQWKAAGDAFQEASRRAPYESTYLLNLALARGQQALSGDDPNTAGSAALQAARGAIDVDPYLSRMSEVADIAFEFGDFDLTLRAAAATTAFFDPSYGHRTFLAAQQAIDLIQARRTLERALLVRETSELRAALGVTILRMGDAGSARANGIRALELEPDNQDARELLRQVGP